MVYFLCLQLEADRDNDIAFVINTSSGKRFFIHAKSRTDRAHWMGEIQAATQRHDLLAKAEQAMRADKLVEAQEMVRIAEGFASEH